MDRTSLISVAYAWRCIALFSFTAMPTFAGGPADERRAEAADLVQESRITLLSAVIAARAEFPAGIPFRAGISGSHPTHAFEVLFLAEDRKRVVRIEIDVICGDGFGVAEVTLAPKYELALAAIGRNQPERLEIGLKRAARLKQGTLIGAQLGGRKDGLPVVDVILLTPTGLSEVSVDALDDGKLHLVRAIARKDKDG